MLPFHKFCAILGPEKLAISILSQSVFVEDDVPLKQTFPNYKTLQNSQIFKVLEIVVCKFDFLDNIQNMN